MRTRLPAAALLAAVLLSHPFSAVAQPVIPVRGVGINEGFANLPPPFALNQPTTVTAGNLANRGYHVVKIWPIYQKPAQLAPIFTDSRIDVVVYRPLDSATQVTECGGTGYVWENADYGALAARLYQLYSDQPKTVILTGWEADNQIKHMPMGHPVCGWPSQADVDSYRQMLEQRQVAVRTVREANLGARLRVYHAVEVRTVPDSSPSGWNDVLEKIVPFMSEPPDFISLSAWSASPPDTKLNTIAAVSHLSHDRIFVGEWGCREKNPVRASCYSDHANAAFNWGVRLWIVWAYTDGGGGPNSYDLVDSQTHNDSANGFSALAPLNTRWYLRF